jgi:hypothetical protein
MEVGVAQAFQGKVFLGGMVLQVTHLEEEEAAALGELVVLVSIPQQVEEGGVVEMV